MILAELLRSGSKPLNLCLNFFKCSIAREDKKRMFSKIILFKVGLIIRKSVIETGIQIFNIHAAKVPEYGGIG